MKCNEVKWNATSYHSNMTSESFCNMIMFISCMASFRCMVTFWLWYDWDDRTYMWHYNLQSFITPSLDSFDVMLGRDITWAAHYSTLRAAPSIEEQYLPSSTSFSIHFGCITSWSRRSDAILRSSSSLSASFVSSSSTGPFVWNCSRSKNGSTHLYVFERRKKKRNIE